MQSSYAVEDCQLNAMLSAAFVNQKRVMDKLSAIVDYAYYPGEHHLALQVLAPKNQKQILVLRLVAQKHKMGLEVVLDGFRGMMRWGLCVRALQATSKQ